MIRSFSGSPQSLVAALLCESLADSSRLEKEAELANKGSFRNAAILAALSIAAAIAFSASDGATLTACPGNGLRVDSSLAPIPNDKIGEDPPDFQKTPSADFIRKLGTQASYRDVLSTDPQMIKMMNKLRRLSHKARKVSSLQDLFDQPTGVDEGYPVGEHTIRVLKTYESQKQCSALNSLSLNASGFNPAETKLSNALIWSHQNLGNYIQDAVAPDTVKHVSDPERAARLGIQEAAQRAGVNRHEFFKLMKLVMTSDAASL